MDATVIVAIIGGVAGTIGSFLGYMSGKNANKKDLAISERQLLSQDEQAFRAELRETLNFYIEESKAYKEEISMLRAEVNQLREENYALILENRQLNAKVDELMSRLGGETIGKD